MTRLSGCQIPCVPNMSEGSAPIPNQTLMRRIKRTLAVPWNYYVKRWLKRLYRSWKGWHNRYNSLTTAQNPVSSHTSLAAGDWVCVQSEDKIRATLDPWSELKGCAFLPYMAEYCGTTQRVLQPVHRFLDERDYKVKKAKGVVLLQGVLCKGTPVFGQCDRACHLFWREEWLEKITPPIE